MSGPNLFSEPESRPVTIKNLATKVVKGEWELRIPSFQRSFVWENDDIKRFFESIINGYPTGTILLWEPSRIDIDPFSLKLTEDFQTVQNAKTYYVIDGQQRLTALILLLNGWKVTRVKKVIMRSPISLNPSKERGELYVGEKRGVDLHRGVKYRVYVDINENQKLQSELQQPSYERYLEVIERILDYNVPLYVIKTYNETPEILGTMANIFIMVNRAGQRISNVELLLSYSAGIFDQELTSKIREFYDELQGKYGEEIDIQPFIRFAFSTPVLGLKQQEIENVEKFKTVVKRVRSQLTIEGKELLPSKIEYAYKSFTLTLDLAKEIFGEAVLDFLPSYLSLIPIAVFLYIRGTGDLRSLSSEDRMAIKKWLLLVNFNGYYSARPSLRLQQDIEILCAHAKSGAFPFYELLNSIKKNRPLATNITKDGIEEGKNRDILKKPYASYLFLLYTALADNEASDLSGRAVKALKGEEIGKHHIFPRDAFKKYYRILEELSEEDYPAKGVNGLGNITLLNSRLNIEISNNLPKEYLPQYSKEEIEKHFIPYDTELWEIEKFDEFCEKRTSLIYNFLCKHYNDIVKMV